MSVDAVFLLVGFAVFLIGSAALVRRNVVELASLGLERWLLTPALIAPTVFIAAFSLRSAWAPALATTLLCTGLVAGLSGRPVQTLWRYALSTAGVALCAALPAFEFTSAGRATEMGKLGIILVGPLTAGLVLGALLGARRPKARSDESPKRSRGAVAAGIVFVLLLLGGSFWPVVAGVVLWFRDGPSPSRAPVVVAPAPTPAPTLVRPVNVVEPVPVAAAPVGPLPSGPPTLAEDLFPLAVGLRWTFVSGGSRSEVAVTGKEQMVIDGKEVEVFRLASPPNGESFAVVDATQVRIYTKNPPLEVETSSSPRLWRTPEGLFFLRSYPRRRPREAKWKLIPESQMFDVGDASLLGSAKHPFEVGSAVSFIRSGCNPQTCESFVVVLVPGVGLVSESKGSSGEPGTSWSAEKTLERFDQ